MKPKPSKSPKTQKSDDRSAPFTKMDFARMVDKAIKPEQRKPDPQ